MMLPTERFIASAISLVRMPPDAPTSAPAMISGVLSSTKPAIATAVPVKALSSEMTTGMSAPPIGSTIEHAEERARPAAASTSAEHAAVPGRSTSRRTPTANSSEQRVGDPDRRGRRSGGRGSTPCSLPAATSEPANVTAPMSDVEHRGQRGDPGSGASGRDRRAGSRRRARCSAAAPPPTALNRLTSCGIAVIATRRAVISAGDRRRPPLRPPAQPVARDGVPSSDEHHDAWSTTAAAMPAAESWLPRRAVAGEFIRCRPSTKQAAASQVDAGGRWCRQAAHRVVSRGRAFRNICQHPVGDHVAAGHVHRREHRGDEQQHVARPWCGALRPAA